MEAMKLYRYRYLRASKERKGRSKKILEQGEPFRGRT